MPRSSRAGAEYLTMEAVAVILNTERGRYRQTVGPSVRSQK